MEPRLGARYGWRARIGFVGPTTGVTRGCEFRRIAPDGVEAFETRVQPTTKDRDKLTTEFVNTMIEQVGPSMDKLEDANVDVMVQGGTPFIFLNGPGFGEELKAELESVASVPVVLMALAVRDAIKALDVSTVSLCTYYNDEFHDLYRAYLEAFDIEVAAMACVDRHLPHVDHIDEVQPVEFADIPPEVTYRTAIEAYHEAPETEAIVISGGNLPSIEILESLETALGIPAISSNQAAFWQALRTCDVNDAISGVGTLLRRDIDGVER